MMNLKSALYPVLLFSLIPTTSSIAATECPIDSLDSSKKVLSKSFTEARNSYRGNRFLSSWMHFEKLLIEKTTPEQSAVGIQCLYKIQSDHPQLATKPEAMIAMSELLKKRAIKGQAMNLSILLIQKSLLKSDIDAIEKFIASGGMKTFNSSAPRVRLILGRLNFLKSKPEEAMAAFNAIINEKQESKLDRSERDFLYFHLKLGKHLGKSYQDSVKLISKLPSKQTAPLNPEEVHIQFWNHVKLNDYQNALNLFFSLKSPYLRDNYYADIYHAASTLFLEKCHFTDANAALYDLKQIYLPVLKWIQKSVKNREAPYEDVMTGFAAETIPIQLMTELLRNTSLPGTQELIQQLNKELKANPKDEKLLTWKTELVRTVNQEIATQMKNVESDLIELFDDARLIEIDLLSKFAKQRSASTSDEEQKEPVENPEEKTANRIGTGEMWADETHVVKVNLDDRCEKKKK